MKKYICLMLVLALLPWYLVSCGAKTEYTVYVGERIYSLDPKKCTSKADEIYVSNLFSGLYEYACGADGSYNLVPADAEDLPSVRETEDGKFLFTFKLKKDLKWSNGEPLTPEDYVNAWNDSAEYSLYTDKGYVFSLVDGYETFVAHDYDAELNMSYDNAARTFSVVLTENSERFLSYTTLPVLFPISRIAKRDSREWDSNPEFFASNGAYTLVSLSNDKLVLKKNAHFRDADEVAADTLTFIFDADSARERLGKEKLDFAFTEKLYYEGEKTEVGIQYLAFNAEDPAIGAFNDENRRKIRMALGIYARVSGAFSDMPDSLCPFLETDDLSTDNDNGMTALDYADLLLETVSNETDLFTWQNGKVYEFPVLTAISAGRDGEDRDLSELADYLRGKGISLRIRNVSWNEFLDVRDSGEYSMLVNTWSYSTLSDGEFLRLFLSDSLYNDTRLGTGQNSAWKEKYDGILLFPVSGIKNSKANFTEAYGVLLYEACIVSIGKAERAFFSKSGCSFTVPRNGIVRFY